MTEELDKDELRRLDMILAAFESYPELIAGPDGIAKVMGVSESYVKRRHMPAMHKAGILLENRQYRKKKIKRKWVTYKRWLFVYLIKLGYI